MTATCWPSACSKKTKWRSAQKNTAGSSHLPAAIRKVNRASLGTIYTPAWGMARVYSISRGLFNGWAQTSG